MDLNEPPDADPHAGKGASLYLPFILTTASEVRAMPSHLSDPLEMNDTYRLDPSLTQAVTSKSERALRARRPFGLECEWASPPGSTAVPTFDGFESSPAAHHSGTLQGWGRLPFCHLDPVGIW